MILVTGATGFIGSALVEALHKKNMVIRAATRKKSDAIPGYVNHFEICNMTPDLNWNLALDNVDVVIHLAARVHVMRDDASDPLAAFRYINTESTLNLASQAAKKGVKRFIYLSTIKVNGESTTLGAPFTEKDKNIPVEPYALSKYEAEQELMKIAKKTNMEVVIIRPPLVYGEGVKANFLTMMKWLNKAMPLPFGSIHNKRSFVALDNLVDLIITCVNHPDAGNQIFLVSDDDDLSTTELFTRVTILLGKKTHLLSINQYLLKLLLSFIRKKELADRLCNSLQVDISKAKKLLNWSPVIGVNEGLTKTTDYFKVEYLK